MTMVSSRKICVKLESIVKCEDASIISYQTEVVNQAISDAPTAKTFIPQGAVLAPLLFLILISTTDANRNYTFVS